jgi:hypothetical protein
MSGLSATDYHRCPQVRYESIRYIYFYLTDSGDFYRCSYCAGKLEGNLQVFEVLSSRSYTGWSTLFEEPKYFGRVTGRPAALITPDQRHSQSEDQLQSTAHVPPTNCLNHKMPSVAQLF